MKPFIIFFCMSLLATAPAHSANTSRPSELPSSITATTPYGTGQLSRLFIVGYDASLWTDAERWSYDAPFALSIIYRMGFTTEELVDRTIEEMRGQGEVSAEEEKKYRASLVKSFPNVKDGDRITALYTPKGKTEFYYNGKPTGAVDDALFAKKFFDIWLSTKTSEPSLRRALLPK